MRCACCIDDCPKRQPFPPEQAQQWRLSLLNEIARGRAVQSRNRRNPRGVKRKVSNFKIRKRSDPLNQKMQPRVVIK